jgi:hypothetical protein
LSFDIITVTETHLNSNVSDDDIKIESFSPNIMRRERDGVAGIIMGYNSVLLWAVIIVGLLITFFKLSKVIISESLLFWVLKRSEFNSPVITTLGLISNVIFSVPSEISDHDAVLAYIECPNSTTSAFKRKNVFI